MRVTKLLIICCVTLIAMATGAPRRSKPGKSGERKRQRSREKNNLTTVLPLRTDEEESENEILEEFIQMDLNGDGLITLKEFKKATGSGNKKVFKLIDTDSSENITIAEFLVHMGNIRPPKIDDCDKFAMGRCGDKFSQHLRKQERTIRRTSEELSTNGLFCASLQAYMNCIGNERSVCEELHGYAQRIKRTGLAYREAGICPEMDVSLLTASQRRPGRGERTRSREARTANERTLSNEDCLRDAFTSCHDELYHALRSRSKKCILAKRYRNCVTRSTKTCRNKQPVKAIISGLKYIGKVHKKENMCVLQT